MLVDSSKINKNLPFTYATLNDIDALVCENLCPRKSSRWVKKANVRIYD